jgi:small subunit ribosomal protein S2
MKQLLEAGVHFGHQTHKWNPKMKKYIFIKRNGIHILDLKQTVDAIHTAYNHIKSVTSKGEPVLFVGTKKQAQEAIKEAAKRADANYVNFRWYGGMLTNMTTIRRSVEKMEYYERIVEDGTINSYTKLEQLKMKREYIKVERALGGVRKLDTLPGTVVVVDTNYEHIAVHEARILGIPIIGMVDTNCNPDSVDFVIPSNDDAIRAIDLIIGILAQAAIDGRQTLTEGYDLGVSSSQPVDPAVEQRVEVEEEIDIEKAVTEYLPDENDMENK